MSVIQPEISVVMAVYNGEKYLVEAIESILQQNYRNFEFIIIDDASTDTSPRIIREFQEIDERIKLISNPSNVGLGVSLKKGIEHTRGEYIARMDADDISMPDRFEKQIDYLRHHPEILILGGESKIINEKRVQKPVSSLPKDPEMMRWNMLLGNGIILIHGSVMFRREFFKKFGSYGDFRAAQDFELWTRTFDRKPLPIANLNQVIYCSRDHEQTTTRSQNNLQEKKALEARLDKIEKFLGRSVSPNVVTAYRHPDDHYDDIQKCIMDWIEIFQKFQKHFFLKKETQRKIKAELLYEIDKYSTLWPRRLPKRQRASFWNLVILMPLSITFNLLLYKMRKITNYSRKASRQPIASTQP